MQYAPTGWPPQRLGGRERIAYALISTRAGIGPLHYRKGGPKVIATVHDHRADLQVLCARYNVRRLALFGSAARGDDFRPESSDLDFLVEFASPEAGRYADRYFGLLADLERLFDRPVDLLDVAAIRNPYLERAVTVSQELLYAAA
jgi:uncharacterized protein